MCANLYGTIPPCCNCGKASRVVLHRHSSSWNNGKLYSVYNGATASSFCFPVHSWATSCFPSVFLNMHPHMPSHWTVVTCAHSPSTASFHSVTLLLASETASIFPVKDQLTLHTGVLKSCNVNPSHWSPSLPCTWLTNTLTLIITRSWCVKNRPRWPLENIGHGVFFLKTAGAKQHSMLMRKYWSWCFVPQDRCLRNRAQSLWGNIGYGVFFLKTAGEKQSSKFMRTMCCMYNKFIPESR